MTDRIEKDRGTQGPHSRASGRRLTDHTEFGTWFRVRLDGPFVPGGVSRRQHHLSRLRASEVGGCRAEDGTRSGCFSFTWHPYAVEPGTDYSKGGRHPWSNSLWRRRRPARGLRLVESGFDKLPAPSPRHRPFARRKRGGLDDPDAEHRPSYLEQTCLAPQRRSAPAAFGLRRLGRRDPSWPARQAHERRAAIDLSRLTSGTPGSTRPGPWTKASPRSWRDVGRRVFGPKNRPARARFWPSTPGPIVSARPISSTSRNSGTARWCG